MDSSSSSTQAPAAADNPFLRFQQLYAQNQSDQNNQNAKPQTQTVIISPSAASNHTNNTLQLHTNSNLTQNMKNKKHNKKSTTRKHKQQNTNTNTNTNNTTNAQQSNNTSNTNSRPQISFQTKKHSSVDSDGHPLAHASPASQSPQKLKLKSAVVSKLSAKSYRSIRVPGHRMIHVRQQWKTLCDPILTKLFLQIRMNSKKNLIELKTSPRTESDHAIQKGADFVRAIVYGFEIRDAIALLRLNDIFLECFDIRDIKFFNKKSDHWMRAIGRIAGQYGKIKYSIENSTNTRIIIFGFKVHILGSFSSIRLARSAISRLVIGSSPGNVYAKLRIVSNRLKRNF